MAMKMILCLGCIAVAQAAQILEHTPGSHTFQVDSAVGFKANQTVVFPGCNFTATVTEVKHVDKIKEKHHVQIEEDESTIKVHPHMPKGACPNVTEILPFMPPATTMTTTAMAALDSSASSGSGASSGSLASSGSGPAGSFNEGSSASLLSGLSGSWESGSWGSQLQIWQWLLLLALLCCCFGGCGAAASTNSKPKSVKKSKSKPKEVAPEAVAEPVKEEVQPLMMAAPQLLPLATSSQFMPSYSMVAAPPMTTAYAAPMTTAYAAPMSYAAAPATSSYMYSAPGTAGQVV